jgi:hypothetical protein
MVKRIEKMRVSDDALDLVFRKARTYNAWLPKPVPEELLHIENSIGGSSQECNWAVFDHASWKDDGHNRPISAHSQGV